MLLSLILLSAILRFYNLTWGAPFYFHPDERNIAASVSQLHFPDQLHPHFFAYGTLPIYMIYLFSVLQNALSSSGQLTNIFSVTFEQAIISSRILSSVLSVLLVLSIFLIGKKLFDQKTGLIAAFLSVFSVGFIQYAHFGTFEMWLALGSLWLFYFCARLWQEDSLANILFVGVIMGLLISVKVSSFVLFFIPLVCIAAHYRRSFTIIKMLLFILTAGIFYSMTSAFSLFDRQAFFSSMKYESEVVLHTLPVFYTGSFFETTPVLFQFTSIYPFFLNPVVTALFVLSFTYVFLQLAKKFDPALFLSTIFFLVLFFSQAFFFAKWSRYMVPTLPFIYLIVAYCMKHALKYLEKRKLVVYKYILFFTLCISSVVFAFSFFITVYMREDSRVQAEDWASKYLPSDAAILSEVYDLGITAFNPHFSNITLFNSYDLDEVDGKDQELFDQLLLHEYIVLPSQRIMKSRLSYINVFPKGNKFYSRLISGELGYKKIYQTPCDTFCKIAYIGSPADLEETTMIFDRPTVYIFHKE